MISFETETMIPLTDAANHMPLNRKGKRIRNNVIYRWAADGLKATDGTHVRLETVKLGGSRYTSTEAIKRFFTRLSKVPGSVAKSESESEPGGSDADHDDASSNYADHQLEAIGI